jgi:hypothetical protein
MSAGLRRSLARSTNCRYVAIRLKHLLSGIGRDATVAPPVEAKLPANRLERAAYPTWAEPPESETGSSFPVTLWIPGVPLMRTSEGGNEPKHPKDLHGGILGGYVHQH